MSRPPVCADCQHYQRFATPEDEAQPLPRQRSHCAALGISAFLARREGGDCGRNAALFEERE